ncbi:OmpA family protein [Halioxenophilus sp. WMMB6]|uniref:OmpA family protein n=1 Tax=Halioxenophilus sp. WMMB6 TaxID=3073815 RepID=UPI00295F144B|nr:OmpA family protein [Halioxenophilus sp. WMMB6]
MRKFTIATLTAIGASLATLPTMAEEQYSGITLTPGLGYYFFDNDRNLEDDALFSIAVGYQFNNPWAFELLYLEANTEADGFGNFDVDHDQLRLDTLYHFNRSGKWQPYLAGGVGRGNFETSFADSDETMLNLGGGLKYYFTDRVALRSDLRAIYGDEDDTFDAALTFGLNILLGGKSSSVSKPASKPAPTPVANTPADSDKDGVADSADQCADTPAGVVVDAVGCPVDSDRDGVADYQDQCPDTAKGAKVDSKGCYLELLEDREVTLKVQFANNSDEVPEAYMGEVEKVATFMREYVNTSVVIEGHTDDRGAASYNQALSERRAKSVASLLTSRFGIAAERVSAVGYGEEKPLVDNDTAENRATNRRVVAVVKTQVKTIAQ